MSLPPFRQSMVKMAVGNYIKSKRPPEAVRHLADLAYRIEGADLVIYEIRPSLNEADSKVEKFLAKATFISDDQSWNIFWMRADKLWHVYEQCESVSSISGFIDVLREDKGGCFWG